MARKPAEIPIERCNYMKIDGRFFGLNEIKVEDGFDVEKEIREFYQTQYKQIKNAVVTDNAKEWDRQLVKLKQARDRSSFAIPTHLTTDYRMSMVYRNVVCEARAVLYYPTKIKASKAMIREMQDAQGRTESERFDLSAASPLMENFGNIERNEILIWEVGGHNKFDIVTFVYDGSQIYTPNCRTIHTMSDFHLCIGNTDPKVFWNDRDFVNNVNMINMFSPATRNHINSKTGVEFHWSQLITRTTLISVSRQEVTTWRAR